MATSTPEPWDRQPGESEPAYAAFRAYRDKGAARSVVEAYRQSEGKPGAKQASGRWNRWVKDHAWEERARAWDNRMGAVMQEAAERSEAEDAEELAKLRRLWNGAVRRRAEALAKKADAMLALPVVRQASADGKMIIMPMSPVHLRAAGTALQVADALARASLDDAETRAAPGPRRPGWTGPPRVIEIRLPAGSPSSTEPPDDDDDGEPTAW